MEKLSELLKASTEISIDFSSGAEVIQTFRKEFPDTAAVILDMDYEKEGISTGKIPEEAMKQAEILHNEMQEFYPVIANIFAEINKRADSGSMPLKTDFLNSAIMREILGLITVVAFTLDWMNKRDKMTTLPSEGQDSLTNMIFKMLPEKDIEKIAMQSWLAVGYSKIGAAEALVQLMVNEKFPPKEGDTGTRTIVI